LGVSLRFQPTFHYACIRLQQPRKQCLCDFSSDEPAVEEQVAVAKLPIVSAPNPLEADSITAALRPATGEALQLNLVGRALTISLRYAILKDRAMNAEVVQTNGIWKVAVLVLNYALPKQAVTWLRTGDVRTGDLPSTTAHHGAANAGQTKFGSGVIATWSICWP